MHSDAMTMPDMQDVEDDASSNVKRFKIYNEDNVHHSTDLEPSMLFSSGEVFRVALRNHSMENRY